MSGEISKYQKCGAYHWLETSRSIRNYNAFLEARYRWVFGAVKDWNNLLVLDLGCGDGVMAYRLKRAGADVVGIDIDPFAVKLAEQEIIKRGKAVNLALSRAEQLPFLDSAFDVVLCAEMLEHVLDPHPILSEITRVLKEGGTLVLTTPYRGTRPQSLKHEHEYTSEELSHLLGRYFESVDIWVSHPLWLKNLYEKYWIKWPFVKWLVNIVSLTLGLNPFYWPKLARDSRGSYSQLMAMAKGPKKQGLYSL